MMALEVCIARHLHCTNYRIEYCTYDPYYNKLYDIKPLHMRKRLLDCICNVLNIHKLRIKYKDCDIKYVLMTIIV